MRKVFFALTTVAAFACAAVAHAFAANVAVVAPPHAVASPILPFVAPTPVATTDSATLSGQIDYSFDPVTVRDGLKDIGVDPLPAHYLPALELSGAGLEFLNIVHDGTTSTTSFSVVVVQDPLELTEKMRALSQAHLSGFLSPLAFDKRNDQQCSRDTGYTIEKVPVKVFACNMNNPARLKMEVASILVGQLPIIVYGQSHSAVFDETAFRQIVLAIAAQRKEAADTPSSTSPSN